MGFTIVGTCEIMMNNYSCAIIDFISGGNTNKHCSYTLLLHGNTIYILKDIRLRMCPDKNVDVIC